MKPEQGFWKVVRVQFWRLLFGSCMDELRWVRHASSSGSGWVECGRLPHVSSHSKSSNLSTPIYRDLELPIS